MPVNINTVGQLSSFHSLNYGNAPVVKPVWFFALPETVVNIGVIFHVRPEILKQFELSSAES